MKKNLHKLTIATSFRLLIPFFAAQYVQLLFFPQDKSVGRNIIGVGLVLAAIVAFIGLFNELHGAQRGNKKKTA